MPIHEWLFSLRTVGPTLRPESHAGKNGDRRLDIVKPGTRLKVVSPSTALVPRKAISFLDGR